jgi:hypothetical protein
LICDAAVAAGQLSSLHTISNTEEKRVVIFAVEAGNKPYAAINR